MRCWYWRCLTQKSAATARRPLDCLVRGENMRKTTEQLAKEKSCCVTQESVDVLFARRKPWPDENEYTWDCWLGMSRIIFASTGRVVCVCEDFNDAMRIMNALNHRTPNDKLSRAGTASA